jgi:uncharacterized protein (DUF2235 family)
MAKNIVVCSDGTGNTSIMGRGTNVFKLFEAVDVNGHRVDSTALPQLTYYDDGVGTEEFRPLKIFAGITGYGLSRNVKQLYTQLVRVYDPGDSIFLFGFSRGAFTVRTLVGLIATCGLIDPAKLPGATALDAAVASAYRLYRRCYRTKLAELLFGKADPQRSKGFREKYSRDCDVTIRFIGVWDTVDAVGLPFHLSDLLNSFVYRFKFPDRRLSQIVEHACHALAVDDERHSFHPLLWDESGETDGRIQQVWFAGAHSNVGGGYPKQGVSLITLDWMMTWAERAGLRFVKSDRTLFRDHANMDDKVYDPRSGLGIFYRWKPRNIGRICRENSVTPSLHVSVLERVAHGTENYTPGNIPANSRVVFTPEENAQQEVFMQQRAKNVEGVLAASGAGDDTLLARVSGAVVVGRLSYYVYLATCTLVLIAASGPGGVMSLLNPAKLLRDIAGLIFGGLTSPVETLIGIVRQLASDPALAAWLGLGFLVAYLLSLIADRRMNAAFSQFWYQNQQKLRDALKQARAAAPARAARHPGA